MNESHINEEWRKEIRGLAVDSSYDDRSKIISIVENLISDTRLQALEQGRTEGREEALYEVDRCIPSFRNQIFEKPDYAECGSIQDGFNECRKEVLVALSKLREV